MNYTGKTPLALLVTALAALALQAGTLTEVYVKTAENGGSDDHTGESWAMAKATIGAALAAVADGGTVTVGPGTYIVDARGTTAGDSPALAVANGVKLVSSDGPEATVILQDRTTGTSSSTILAIGGAGSTVSGFAISDFIGYGVYFTANGAVLTNCVIRNLRPLAINKDGAAIYIKGFTATVANCTVSNNLINVSGGSTRRGIGLTMTGNALASGCVFADNRIAGASTSATGGGAAVYMTNGTLRNCLVVGNSDISPNGAAVQITRGTIESCTVAGNTSTGASSCGGVWMTGTGVKTLRNSIFHGNVSSGGNANWKNDGSGLAASYCDADAAFDGEGNLAVDPAFAADWSLGAGKCVDGGVNMAWMAGATDLAGNARIVNGTVDMGCFEKVAAALEAAVEYSPATGLLAPCEVVLSAQVSGSDLAGLSYKWEFDNPAVEGAEGAGHAQITRTLQAAVHAIRLTVTNASGETASYSCELKVGPRTAYANAAGAGVFPYDTPENGATNVSQALDAAVDGTRVEILPGAYMLTETAAVRNGVRVHGASPEACVLDAGGQSFPALDLAHADAFVDGLTLTGSTARGLVISEPGVVSNCVVSGNLSVYGLPGAGVYFVGGGTLARCTVAGNSITAGGYSSSGCAIYCAGNGPVIDSCFVTGNAGQSGNGYGTVHLSLGGTVRNTVIAGNSQTPDSAQDKGSAGLFANTSPQAGATVVENCTIVDNADTLAAAGAGLYVGGSGSVTVRNTVVWGNTAAGAPADCQFSATLAASVAQCSILDGLTAAFAAEGVFHADPMLDSKWRPSALSPCVNKGANLAWMAGARDVRGNRRIVGPGVDIGAVEYILTGLRLSVR